VDFDSEVVRFAGSARFAIWALKKVIDWDVHKGMLFYYPEEAPPKLHKPPEEPIENVDDNSNSNESNTSEPEVKIDETKPTEDAQSLFFFLFFFFRLRKLTSRFWQPLLL
jgi:hypothetical protein